MEEGKLYSRLFPEKADAAECVYPNPDWDALHRELRKMGVTLRLLHGEYADAPKAEVSCNLLVDSGIQGLATDMLCPDTHLPTPAD